jgi:outer membrane protein assembly factor BamB
MQHRGGRSWASIARRSCAAVAMAGAALALVACGSRSSGSGTPQAGGGPGWRAPNGDLASTRWVSGPIDAASVARLRVAWSVSIPPYVTTPLVVDGVLYTQDLTGTVYASDVASGRLRWQQPIPVELGGTPESQNGGPNGVALGDGRVYATTSTHAFALDASSGRLLWARKLVRGSFDGIDMAPGYLDGTAYISTVPVRPGALYGPGARGILWALDGKTGRTRWSWESVPRDLWGRPHVNSGGGLWYTPSFDAAGAMYVATGNPGPVPGIGRYPWAVSRPGPNRWTDSIVKLDARSGRVLWARQVLAHDLYDWDLACPVILVRAHGRALAIAGGKMGFVYAFDQRDGRLVWKRSVGQHNGHDDDGLRLMRHPNPHRAPTRILPGTLGGVISPMAADRTTVYVPVNNLGALYGPTAIVRVDPLRHGTGEVVALDLATGRVRWDRKLPSSAYGAATVANDVVFTTTYDGTIWGLRTSDGRTAWREELPAGTNAPVAVAGDTLIAAATRMDDLSHPTKLLAYRLGGARSGSR